MRRCAAIVAVCLLAPIAALAHPAPFSYLDLRLTGHGIDGSLIVHDFDVAHDFGVEPPDRFLDPAFSERYRGALMRLMESRFAVFVDGRRVPIEWTGLETLPQRQSLRLLFHAAGSRIGRIRIEAVLFPYDPVHQTFVNVYEGSALRHQAILDGERAALDYYAGTWQGAGAVLAVFIPAGIEHILIGPDHVLFLVGLLLLGGSLWRLTTIVTAFTLGHSITLALAALDVVSPPAAVIEPIIALSIVFVGADNLLVQRDRTQGADGNTARLPRDIRPWVAAVVGLVHGFGFATVLKEFGLPLTALGWSLFSFNVGVEIGQLAIVLIVATLLGVLRQRNPRAATHIVVGGSLAVIFAGGYWFIERVFLSG